MMTNDPTGLAGEIGVLARDYTELGHEFQSAAKRLRSPGIPLSEELLRAVGTLRQRFQKLREQVRQETGTVPDGTDSALKLLSALEVARRELAKPPEPSPIFKTPESAPRPLAVPPVQAVVQPVEPMPVVEVPEPVAPAPAPVVPAEIAAVAPVAVAPGSGTGDSGAMDVLDSLLSMVHAGPGELAGLEECKESVRTLRAAIAAGHAADDAKKLANGEHSLARLLIFAFHKERLSDNAWADTYEFLISTFGRPLAQAASRGRLKMRK